MTAQGPTWSAGTAIVPAGAGRVAVSCAHSGRLFRASSSTVAEVIAWVAEPTSAPPPLVDKLLAVGVLTAGSDAEHIAETPTLSYHLWSQRDNYLDGADEHAERREEVLDRFGEARRSAIRGLASTRPAPDVLPPFLSDIVWDATERIRLYRGLNARASTAATTFYSYGAAFDLYVLVPGAAPHTVLRADLDAFGHGQAINSDATDALRAAGLGTTKFAVAIVGRLEDFQLRYHHEKALRGFFVDGGRLLTEVGRAMQARFPATRLLAAPPATATCRALGLDPQTHVVLGVSSVGDQQTAE